MKFRTTTKAIRRDAMNPVSAGYCELQSLLRYHEPIAYTCGVYGWNFDAYEVHGLTICTGYRGMVGPHVKNAAEYERKADEIISDWSIPYDEKRDAVDKLLRQFCIENGGH